MCRFLLMIHAIFVVWIIFFSFSHNHNGFQLDIRWMNKCRIFNDNESTCAFCFFSSFDSFYWKYSKMNFICSPSNKWKKVCPSVCKRERERMARVWKTWTEKKEYVYRMKNERVVCHCRHQSLSSWFWSLARCSTHRTEF